MNYRSQISFKDFILFFCKDIKSMDFEPAFTPEIVFRIGVEIFRVMGKERTYLELRDLMDFLKENETLDIDFIQFLEMFDFYDDIYSGTFKRKVNILSFFQKTGLKIAKAFDKQFLDHLSLTFKDCKRQENMRNIIKVYEKNSEGGVEKKKVSEKNSRKKAEIRKACERNLGQMPNINEIIIEDITNEMEPASCNNLQKDIEEFFKENQPKNKGWLFRKSSEKSSDWQNVFFSLTHGNTRLISLQPKKLQKELEIPNIVIHKCNFLECIEPLKTKKNQENIKSHRSSDKQCKQCFFIVEQNSGKTYLLKSDESLAILSVINFYKCKKKNSTSLTKNNENSLIQIIETVEPYYSGVIEIACCKQKNTTNFHSDLKSYSFKSNFLEIKANKLLIHQFSLKDSISLLDFELKMQEAKDKDDPPSSLFPFFLEKKNINSTKDEVNKKQNEMKDNSFVVFNTLPENQEPHSKHLEVIYEKDEPGVIKEKENGKFSRFKDFLKRISKKKQEKLVLAADSEFKRKEWIFSLNYYKTLILKNILKLDKIKPQTESFQIKSPINNANVNFFKSSLHEKSSKNPDFYDVFAENQNEDKNKNILKENEPKIKKAVFYTEPDGKNLGN